MTLSKSPERNTFQKEGYLKRQQESGEPVNEAYLEMWETVAEQTAKQEADPEWQKDNLEWDLRSTDWILEKARTNKNYAQNIYAALCNMRWIRREMWPLLKEEYWSCSWRYAGGIVADMLQEGDYIDWYCSGIRNDGYQDDLDIPYPNGYVPEGTVTEEVEKDLNKLGWIPFPWSDDENI
jgi:hypothetical protein